MPERPEDRQLNLSFRSQNDVKLDRGANAKPNRPITDLNRVRAWRHGTAVLERVIREGYTKKNSEWSYVFRSFPEYY